MRTLCLLLFVLAVASAAAEENYPVPDDAVEREDVAKGRVDGPFDFESAIFPGTQRQYWVYVPADYDADQPSCLCVVQDGMRNAKNLRLPTVFDNLIADGVMPVTLGLFVTPGIVPAGGEGTQPRFNRSFEYDALGDRYARFLIEELIPKVSETYAVSEDPNDRMICGSSSGGVCAWTAAWERPDAFRRVFTSVGTYVGLRGADAYPVMVRKYEPRPIRIFLQDGRNDLDIYAGSWWNANQSMLSALEWAGYDVEHVWGEGGHNGKHAAAVFPEACRWLWRDYPEPITAGHAPQRRTDILIDGEDWKLVSDGHKWLDGPAAREDGTVFVPDVVTGEIFQISPDGKVSPFVDLKTPEELLAEAKDVQPELEWTLHEGYVHAEPTPGEPKGYRQSRTGCSGLMFGPDGQLYGLQPKLRRVVRFDEDGDETVVTTTDFPLNDLCVTPNGIYITVPKSKVPGYVAHFDFEGTVLPRSRDLGNPNGLHTTADQRFLWVSDYQSRFVSHLPLSEDGTFVNLPSAAPSQDYGWLHLDGDSPKSGGDGMTLDSEGRAYVSTAAGVQVLDQLGRVHLILTPPGHPAVTNLVVVGVRKPTLFLVTSNKLYSRRVTATGVRSWQTPVAPPKPGL